MNLEAHKKNLMIYPTAMRAFEASQAEVDELIKDLDMLEKDETFSSSEFNSNEDGDVDQHS